VTFFFEDLDGRGWISFPRFGLNEQLPPLGELSSLPPHFVANGPGVIMIDGPLVWKVSSSSNLLLLDHRITLKRND
jgi:hypothetical protein